VTCRGTGGVELELSEHPGEIAAGTIPSITRRALKWVCERARAVWVLPCHLAIESSGDIGDSLLVRGARRWRPSRTLARSALDRQRIGRIGLSMFEIALAVKVDRMERELKAQGGRYRALDQADR
jgi:hypothetical protein